MDAALRGPRPRRALMVTALAPVVPQLLGSAFNIWYNLAVVEPLLGTEALKGRFLETCVIYNAIVYPVAMVLWLRQVFSIGPVVRMLASGLQPEAAALVQARRRIINLPWRRSPERPGSSAFPFFLSHLVPLQVRSITDCSGICRSRFSSPLSSQSRTVSFSSSWRVTGDFSPHSFAMPALISRPEDTRSRCAGADCSGRFPRASVPSARFFS